MRGRGELYITKMKTKEKGVEDLTNDEANQRASANLYFLFFLPFCEAGICIYGELVGANCTS